MSYLISLAFACAGFFMVGYAAGRYVMLHPGGNPLWAFPVTVFLFFPFLVFGGMVAFYLGVKP